MKTYELSYIISPEITSEEAQAKSKEIETAIQSKEGVVLKQINPIAKTFAFPIGKRASGFFGVLEFQIEPEKMAELQEIVQRPGGCPGKIVRHMVTIKEVAKIRKERRSKPVLTEAVVTEQKSEDTTKEESASAKASAGKEKDKVELKDIEQKLEELLG